MLIFVALLAHMAVFILSETIEPRPQGIESQSQGQNQSQAQGTQGPGGLLVEHKQRSLDIVHKLGTLTAILEQLNHFRVSLWISILTVSHTKSSCHFSSRTNSQM